MTSICIFCIFLNKFSYLKEPSQIIWLIIDKSLGVSLDFTILSLSLTINLKIKDKNKLLLNSQKVIEGWLEFCSKNIVPITHNWVS